VNRLLRALVLPLCLTVCPFSFGAEEGTARASIRPEAPMQEIESGPKDVREKTELYVFLGWMWILILISLYVLHHKARQADALARYRFFEEPPRSLPK